MTLGLLAATVKVLSSGTRLAHTRMMTKKSESAQPAALPSRIEAEYLVETAREPGYDD